VPLTLDFTDDDRRRQFLAAKKLITDGYRIMRDDVGADNPADNAFLREATICAAQGLVWVGDRGGTDARTPTGEEVEIKSTRLDDRATIAFPTSRYVSPTVIARFRAADWFAFGVFDLYEELIALYRVEKADMTPLIDVLEQKMLTRQAAGQAYENNPKFSYASVRRVAQTLYFDAANYAERNSGTRWTILKRRP
jgi:hypothetical protein